MGEVINYSYTPKVQALLDQLNQFIEHHMSPLQQKYGKYIRTTDNFFK
jgi:hypothetical protein|tara:strand:- start:848 stop:991 length:144 start_codon:yes stop_codon:yes gene_type:complete